MRHKVYVTCDERFLASCRTVRSQNGRLTPETIILALSDHENTPIFMFPRVVSGNRDTLKYGPRPSYRTVREKAGL